MTAWGQSRPGRTSGRSGHVRNAPLATVGLVSGHLVPTRCYERLPLIPVAPARALLPRTRGEARVNANTHPRFRNEWVPSPNIPFE